MKNISLLLIMSLFASAIFAQTSEKRNLFLVESPTKSPTDQVRKAVVIGMSDYGEGRSLSNTLNDAEDMANVLTQLGFEVTLLKNNDLRNLETNLNNWYTRIEGNDMAVFYFAGHGLEVTGENYLIPIGVELNSQSDVKYSTLNVNQVLDNMNEKRVGMKLLILDACRDNPFKRSWGDRSESKQKGLAQMSPPRGTYIAFAASPGSTAQDGASYNLKNGVFTFFLKQEIIKAGISIDEIFNNVTGYVSNLTNEQQTPFKNSSLSKTFYFIPPSESPLVLLEKANAYNTNKQYNEAFPLYEQSANAGNADAQYRLGNYYYNGWGVKQDLIHAVEWYKRAADQGSDVAQNILAFCYESGYGVTKDNNHAIEWYKRAAEQGNINSQQSVVRLQKIMITEQLHQAATYYINKQYNDAFPLLKQNAEAGNADAEAQNNLGNCYYNGWGVTQDYTHAFEWYRRASEQGYAEAEYNIGVCYANGNGVSKDIKQATEWYKKSAGQGNISAQVALDRLPKTDRMSLMRQANDYYSNKQYEEAFSVYMQLAEAGNADAETQNKLGICYYNGYGTAQDFKQAVYRFGKAADQGNANAQTNLGICYQDGSGVTKDYKEAVNRYKKSAGKGEAKAQINLGVCYYNGWGIKLDYTKAVYWYKKAAEQGKATAQYNLGTCYEDGNGVIKDNTQAAYWYRKAADQGDADAKKALERIMN